MITNAMWLEQENFNKLLREVPISEADAAEFAREMGLHMISEVDEFLRTTAWKKHRKIDNHRPNHDHRLDEIVDMLKLWMTIVQGFGYTDLQVQDAFWRKSMVCRQRYAEEWMQQASLPSVVVDIDNVLCDYTSGFCDWLARRAPLTATKATKIKESRAWFSRATQFGLTEVEWQGFKHEFRTLGHKRDLPVMPGAKTFLDRLRTAGYRIILLTSRPIDRYPNIYGDTLAWLSKHELVYDFVWWSSDKGERLIEGRALSNVKFVVDDDPRYVSQFVRVGLPVWNLQTPPSEFYPREWDEEPAKSLVRVVRSLAEIEIPELLEGEQHGV